MSDASAWPARSPYCRQRFASASRARRSWGSTERSPCSAFLRSWASSSFSRGGPVSVCSADFTVSPPCASVVSVIARGHEGGPGENVGHLAQLQERGLGLAAAVLLRPALAGRDHPPQAAQLVGRRRQLGGGAGAGVAPHGTARGPLAAVVIPPSA